MSKRVTTAATGCSIVRLPTRPPGFTPERSSRAGELIAPQLTTTTPALTRIATPVGRFVAGSIATAETSLATPLTCSIRTARAPTRSPIPAAWPSGI